MQSILEELQAARKNMDRNSEMISDLRKILLRQQEYNHMFELAKFTILFLCGGFIGKFLLSSDNIYCQISFFIIAIIAVVIFDKL